MASLSARIGSTANHLYPRLTADSADDLAKAPAGEDFEPLIGRRYCVVVSYRRDGRPVATPVWFGMDGERLCFRSLEESWKVKRIAADPRVLVAPCTRRGKPTGPPALGRARILPPGPEEARAEALIQASFGLIRRGYKRAIRDAAARYVEVTPESERATPRSR